MNPIYIKYSPHSNCNCYAVDLPWPRYAKHTIILCPEEKGANYAKTLLIGVIFKHLNDRMNESEPIFKNEEE